MFKEFNDKLRKKLICLYEDFILNPKNEILKENAAIIAEKYSNSGNYNLTQNVNLALTKVYKMELGELSVKEAKKVLKDLKIK